jgi:hypothetical protein
LLLMTGAPDEEVRPENSISLAHRVRASGGHARLIVYPERGHGGILLALAQPLQGLDPVLRDAVAFIRKQAARCRADALRRECTMASRRPAVWPAAPHVLSSRTLRDLRSRDVNSHQMESPWPE